MKHRIIVIGISGSELAPEHRLRIAACHAVVASKRFAPLVTGLCDHILPVAPVADMLEALTDELRRGDVAVLASGDPLFFGIGRTLLQRFGREGIIFYPALSAVQLACARFKVPWDDMVFLSLHGRDPGELASRILSHPRVMLFTDHRNAPDRIASLLLKRLQTYTDQCRLDGLRVRVAENLGMEDERLTSGSLREIAACRFSPLNMMLIEQDLQALPFPRRFGLREDEIVHSRGLITKDEIRAVTLHCLRLPEQGVFWDVGAGSGSVSLEAAGCCPQLAIHAVEHNEEQQRNIRDNIVRYRRDNIHLVPGTAPEILATLPAPDRIFIGGSGGRLQEIITVCARRLRNGGRMVVNGVLRSTAEQAPFRLAENGLTVDIRRLRVDRRSGPDADWYQLNPITIITAIK